MHIVCFFFFQNWLKWLNFFLDHHGGVGTISICKNIVWFLHWYNDSFDYISSEIHYSVTVSCSFISETFDASIKCVLNSSHRSRCRYHRHDWHSPAFSKKNTICLHAGTRLITVPPNLTDSFKIGGFRRGIGQIWRNSGQY